MPGHLRGRRGRARDAAAGLRHGRPGHIRPGRPHRRADQARRVGRRRAAHPGRRRRRGAGPAPAGPRGPAPCPPGRAPGLLARPGRLVLRARAARPARLARAARLPGRAPGATAQAVSSAPAASSEGPAGAIRPGRDGPAGPRVRAARLAGRSGRVRPARAVPRAGRAGTSPAASLPTGPAAGPRPVDPRRRGRAVLTPGASLPAPRRRAGRSSLPAPSSRARRSSPALAGGCWASGPASAPRSGRCGSRRRSGPRPPLPAGARPEDPRAQLVHHPERQFYRVDTAIVLPEIAAVQLAAPDPRHGRQGDDADLRRPHQAPADRGLRHADLRIQPGRRPLRRQRQVAGREPAQPAGQAGIKAGADQLLCTSSDGFTSGTPIEVTMDGRDAMLAVAMNGTVLPVEHGFPVRMVVPGLYGYVSACKWITDIEVTTFAASHAYWTVRGWSQQAPIKTESRIDVPAGSARSRPVPRRWPGWPGPSTRASRPSRCASTAGRGTRPGWPRCPTSTPGGSGPGSGPRRPACT